MNDDEIAKSEPLYYTQRLKKTIGIQNEGYKKKFKRPKPKVDTVE